MNITLALVGLAAFAVLYSLYGGLKAVAFTDIIQVVLLVAGGFLITYVSLDSVSGGAGPIAGFNELLARAPEKFDLILSKTILSIKTCPELAFYSAECG